MDFNKIVAAKAKYAAAQAEYRSNESRLQFASDEQARLRDVVRAAEREMLSLVYEDDPPSRLHLASLSED